MWPFKRKKATLDSSNYGLSVAGYYDAMLIKRLDALSALGHTVTWTRLEAIQETEAPVILPKDILSELEKLDEERINEHLNASGVQADQDLAARLSGAQGAAWANQQLGQLNQLTAYASAYPFQQRRTW